MKGTQTHYTVSLDAMPHNLISAFKDIGGVLAVAGIIATAGTSHYRIGKQEEQGTEERRRREDLERRHEEALRLITKQGSDTEHLVKAVDRIERRLERVLPGPIATGAQP